MRTGYLLVLLALVVALPAAAIAESDAQIEAQCRPYYDAACSEAMGRWLPSFAFSSIWMNESRAVRIDRRDGFVYHDEQPSQAAGLGFEGPRDGSFFVYGEAGPVRGRVVYDRRNRIAFYMQGCCSWQDVVVATGVGPPPAHVVEEDLSQLVTRRGIRLGMTPRQVIAIYGSAHAFPLKKIPGVSALAYTTWPAAKTLKVIRMPCGQDQNFYFRDGRLIEIQLGNGC